METRSTPPVVVTSSMASMASSLTTTGEGRNGREQSPRSEVYPDLERERQNCPFSQEELTNLLDGGVEKTAERRALEEYFISFVPELVSNGTASDTMSATQRYDDDIRKATELYKIAKQNGSMEATRAMLGAGIGTYAQTELGHGTFIRGLETTATYDPRTEEFILNSPTLTAFKWWPGGLGKTANYAIVMANLFTQGQKRGPHPFIVQLRDEETHRPLKGIKVGEIGPKLGMNANDNGFLGFDQHRIPRDHMLMKNAKVLSDGTYVKPPQEKLSYGTMVFVRVAIVQDCAAHLKKAVTIAIRYSAVRRQSELYPNEAEVQIMDYQTQQAKLFPALAMSFGFHFSGQALFNEYVEVTEQMESGQNFDRLPELHSLACGLKALVTQEVADAIDVVRKACGGHGFMASSNLPRLWGLVTASCTYEGENTVLQLQVARYLVKSCRKSSEALPSSIQYLSGCLNSKKSTEKAIFDLVTPTGLVNLFQRVARGQIAQSIRNLDELNEKTHRPEDAWNQSSLELTQAAMAHIRYYVIAENARVIHQCEASKPIKSLLKDCLHLMALTWMFKYSGDFQTYAQLSPKNFEFMRKQMNTLLSKLRPIAVSIVDAFDIHDSCLLSTLGSYDGQVYKRMFEAAEQSELNQNDVQPAFEKYLKPIMKSNL